MRSYDLLLKNKIIHDLTKDVHTDVHTYWIEQGVAKKLKH